MPTAVVTGFLGSHAAAELDRRGWSVRGLTRETPRSAAASSTGAGGETLDGADLDERGVLAHTVRQLDAVHHDR